VAVGSAVGAGVAVGSAVVVAVTIAARAALGCWAAGVAAGGALGWAGAAWQPLDSSRITTRSRPHKGFWGITPNVDDLDTKQEIRDWVLGIGLDTAENPVASPKSPR